MWLELQLRSSCIHVDMHIHLVAYDFSAPPRCPLASSAVHIGARRWPLATSAADAEVGRPTSRCRGAHGIRPLCGSAAILHANCNLFEQHWIAAAIIHIQRSHCSLWSSMVCRIAAAIIHMTCIAHTYHRSLPSQLRRRARREPPVQTCPADRCCEAGRVMQKGLWCLLQLARYIVS